MEIGITTTIPVEVVYAAGHTPVDLNNIFITSPDPQSLIRRAEHDGYPSNACAWIKGIYAIAIERRIKTVIAAVEGDCSQTQAMIETLEMHGIEIIPFAFPHDRSRKALRRQIEKLAERLGADWNDVLRWKTRLDTIRRMVHKLDEMTWRDGKVSGFENHIWQVSTSDFNGNPNLFEHELAEFLSEVESRPPRTNLIRIGIAGIPPIFTDFHEFIESKGAAIVLNEIQRQFTMPFDTNDIVEQYALYTYPYDIFGRIEDLKREINRRNIQGLIHYTQSFCFRQIQDIILRKHIEVPILTIEGESPGTVDARTKIRIESFLEMLDGAFR